MEDSIRVTTEYLKEKEEEWKTLLQQAQRFYQEAAQCAEKLEQTFCCREITVIRKEYLERQEEGMKAFGALISHLDKLNDMALVYEEAERSNVSVTNSD